MQHQLFLAQNALARAALSNLLDGAYPHDLQSFTGLDLAYCEEVYALLSAPSGSVQYVDAFLAVTDGLTADDIYRNTDLPRVRCEEIIGLRNELMPH